MVVDREISYTWAGPRSQDLLAFSLSACRGVWYFPNSCFMLLLLHCYGSLVFAGGREDQFIFDACVKSCKRRLLIVAMPCGGPVNVLLFVLPHAMDRRKHAEEHRPADWRHHRHHPPSHPARRPVDRRAHRGYCSSTSCLKSLLYLRQNTLHTLPRPSSPEILNRTRLNRMLRTYLHAIVTSPSPTDGRMVKKSRIE